MPRPRPDYAVYLVTDRPLCLGRALKDVVLASVQGGATVVQLREKYADAREFVELGRELKKTLAPLGVPLFINDRVDVALACGADGVHVGQSDIHPVDVRAMLDAVLGPEALLGLSVESAALAREAMELPEGVLDYLGVGPVYQTATKADAKPPFGLDGLKELRRVAALPLVAIGGIKTDNARAVCAAGADGLAVVSAICSAEDPAAAAAALLAEVRKGRAACGKE